MRAIRAIRAIGAIGAIRALRDLRTLGTLGTLGALGALGAIRDLRDLRAPGGYRLSQSSGFSFMPPLEVPDRFRISKTSIPCSPADATVPSVWSLLTS